MACRLFGTIPLSKPMLNYCQLGLGRESTLLIQERTWRWNIAAFCCCSLRRPRGSWSWHRNICSELKNKYGGGVFNYILEAPGLMNNTNYYEISTYNKALIVACAPIEVHDYFSQHHTNKNKFSVSSLVTHLSLPTGLVTLHIPSWMVGVCEERRQVRKTVWPVNAGRVICQL